MTWRAVALCIALLLGSPALAGDGKSLMPAVDTQVYEKLVRLFWPRATLEWDRGDLLVTIGGRQRVVTVADFSHWRGPRRSWFAAVGAVEFSDEVTDAAARLQRFEAVPAGTVPLRVGFMRTDEAGTVLAFRAIVADMEPAVATPITVGEVMSRGNPEWPLVAVEYGGLYSGSDWIASIDWQARIATASGCIVWRTPLRLLKRWRSGRTVRRTYATREVGRSVRVVSNGWFESVTVSCNAGECVVPAERMLKVR